VEQEAAGVVMCVCVFEVGGRGAWPNNGIPSSRRDLCEKKVQHRCTTYVGTGHSIHARVC
jgi:hypothetical protein